MSKKVDERVVEMRFDNRDFEKNVSTTMSTLDRLKAALKFPNSSKTFDGISKAAKNVDFSGMAKGIETVNARFSALQVVGMTALSNITSAAMRAGANLVKSFTIDPITSGFREYELQMNSIQTILANTKSKGTTMADVTAALDELNEYADLTIYNFAEMTKNIGTFTAAGVDLDTSVGAIKGIANLGAMSSSTSAQVSTAMYQLSQALATGRVSLMDWNSVVNAGMSGEQFQNALKRTARNFGYDVDGMIKKYGSFRESLTQGGWLTAEVLNETLNQIGGAYDEVALRAKGYSESQIKEILDLAETATNAATEVKTFTQLLDTLKEAAGSGWAKTWQLIFGDFEQAKEFFSGLHDMLEPIVTGPIDAMNSVIEGAMGAGGNRWSEFTSKLDSVGVSVDAFQKKLAEVAQGKGVDLNALITEYGSLEKAIGSGEITIEMMNEALRGLASSTDVASGATRTLAEWQKVVDDVWYGTYGNVDTGRVERLAAAGWEFAEVQKLVNMTVDGHRLTLEDLTAAQIESMGYTQEQAQAISKLSAELINANGNADSLLQNLIAPRRSGRELFLEGLENVLTAIIKPLQAVAQAFGDVFGMDSNQLYNLIEGFNEFSKSIIMSDDDAENLRRTLRGLFSVIHIVTTAVGRTFAVAFKAANTVLGFFGTNLLEVTGFLGDALYAFDRWITSGEVVESIINAIGTALSWAIGPIQSFFSSFADATGISKVLSGIKSSFDGIINYFNSFEGLSIGDIFLKIVDDVKAAFNKLRNLKWPDVLEGLSNFGSKAREVFNDVVEKIKEIGPDIIEGLQNGLKDGIDGVFEFMTDLGTKIIEAVKAVLGIHSPSTVFFEIGKNIIEGLCDGIKYLSGKVTDTLLAIIGDVKTVMSEIDWGPILAVSAAAGTFIVFYQLTDALQTFATGLKQFTAPAQSAAGVMDAVRDGIRKFTGTNTSSKGFKNFADGVKVLAEAVAILAGSVAVLSVLDTGSLIKAVAVIAVLSGLLVGLAAAMNKFSNGATVLEQLKLNSIFLSLAGAFLILAVASKIIATIEWEGLAKAGASLAVFGVIVGALTYVTKYAGDLNGAAAVLSKIGLAFLLLAATAKILGGMEAGEMKNAGIMLAAFTGVVAALIAVTRVSKGVSGNIGSFVGKIGIAFLMLAATAKILGSMSGDEMKSAGVMLAAFTAVVASLIAVTKFAGNHINKVSDFLGKVGLAFMALAVAARLLGGMSFEEMGRAGVALAGLTGVVAALVAITNLAPKEKIAQISATLLAMSASIAIIAGVAVLLGMIETENLVKGIAAVGALSLLVAVMTQATRGAANVKGSFIGMAVAIAAIAASVAVLSFIEPSRLFSAAAALGAVMAVFALVVRQTSRLKKMKVGPIIAMIGVISALAGVIYLLSGLPIESTTGNAMALSALLLAFSASLKILDSVHSISKSAMKAMAELTLIVGALAVILGIMSALDVTASFENVQAISLMLMAMSAACLVLDNVHSVSKSAMKAMGTLTLIVTGLAVILGIMSALDVTASLANVQALSLMLIAMSAACLVLDNVHSVSKSALTAMGVLTAVVAGLAVILGLMDALDVEASLPTAQALSVLLLAMSGATAILAMIGPAAAAAIPAAGSMAAVIGILAGVVAAAGAIKQIPGVDWLISEGGEFLQSIGEAIGKLIGGLVGGALDGLTDNLGSVADNLSDFMTRLTPFLTGLKMLDPSAQESINALVNMIGTLTGAGLIDSITTFLTGESSMTKFAEQLVPFGEAMMEYSQAVTGIDANAITASATAGKALGELAANLPKEGGLAQAIFGESPNIADFGTQLVLFGNALRLYAASVSGVDFGPVSASAQAGQALSELANSLPKEGGLSQAIFGETTDLDEFGTQLVSFGDALSRYSGAVADLAVEPIQNSVAAGQALSQLANSLGEKDSLWGMFAGGNKQSISDFGDQLVSFGDALSMYSQSLDGVNLSSINTATATVKNIIAFIEELATVELGSIKEVYTIKQVGTALSQYYDAVSEINFGTVTQSINSIQNLVNAINNMVGIDSSGVGSFKAAINELSTIDFSSLADGAMEAASKMVDAGLKMASNLARGITNGGSQARTAIQVLVISVAKTVADSYQAFYTGGKMFSKNLADGLNAGKLAVSFAVIGLVSGAKGQITNYYQSFYSAGAYLASGLAAGLRSKQSAISTAAANIANIASKAVRAAGMIKSPSRLWAKYGGYFGQGLVNGLTEYSGAVYDASYKVGDSATEGLSRAISGISDVFGSDFSDSPVITPVVDLSNVENGAMAINNLLNESVPLGTINQAASINRLMNSRIQNGSFNDVVSAIDKLRTGLSELDRTVYQVNGITYDDGSNIATAVGQLVRSARIERRS